MLGDKGSSGHSPRAYAAKDSDVVYLQAGTTRESTYLLLARR